MEEHIGERFGKLEIIGIKWNEKRKRNNVVCKCDCGNVVEQQYIHLTKGKVKSCGCLLKEVTDKRVEEGKIKEEERKKKAEQYFLNQRARAYIKQFKEEYRQYKKQLAKQLAHDLRQNNRKLYYVWQNMLQRCTNPTHEKYPNYGSRGITVCMAWHTFEGFHTWAIHNGYGEGLSLDRIDTNGNYEPSNCRWVDMTTQCNNKRTNVWLERDGEIHTMVEWTRLLGINYDWFKKTWQNKGFKRVDYDDVNR